MFNNKKKKYIIAQFILFILFILCTSEKFLNFCSIINEQSFMFWLKIENFSLMIKYLKYFSRSYLILYLNFLLLVNKQLDIITPSLPPPPSSFVNSDPPCHLPLIPKNGLQQIFNPDSCLRYKIRVEFSLLWLVGTI